jgi:imidazole glycerol-phosphate synthase subunit HisH
MSGRVGIVDYGVGNVSSVVNAVRRAGHRAVIGANASDFIGVSAIVLPGVGSFPFAMSIIRAGGLDHFLRACYEQQEVKIIGICLGMQVMFDHSEEGDEVGLGILPGRVRALPEGRCHVGWNNVHKVAGDGEMEPMEAFYFNHSFYVDCDRALVQRTSEYVVEIPAVVRSQQFVGTQFHPEKSQLTGAALLEGLLSD